MENEIMEVFFSETEAKTLNLKIARVSVHRNFNAKALLSIIEREKVEIVRLKIVNPGREIYSTLEQLPFDYYIQNILHIFERPPFEVQPAFEMPENLSFVSYEKGMESILEQLVLDTFAQHDGAYFFHPQSNKIYSPADELKSMCAYLTSQYNNEHNRWTKLLLHHNEFVGFVSYVISNNIATGDMFGVASHFQKKGLGKLIGNYVLHTFYDKTVRNNIQIQKFESLNLHYSLGLKPTAFAINIIIDVR
jgi:hypothetical protein